MSREELEKRALEARYNLVSSKDKETIDILEELAIKALEQEPILDKIRAEIRKKRVEIGARYDDDPDRGTDYVCEIIDRYGKEQE